MKKFTIFTILLTIVVVVVFVELMAKDNLSGNVATEQGGGEDMKLTLPKSLDVKRSISTNVLGSDGELNNKLGADNEVLPVSLIGREKIGNSGALKSSGENNSGNSDALKSPGENNSGNSGAGKNAGSDDLEASDAGNPIFLDPSAFENDDQPVDVTELEIKDMSGQLTTQEGDKLSGLKDFEDQNFVTMTAPTGNVYLRDEQIKSAGFTSGTLENEPLDGRLFKTIDISDLKDVEVTKTAIKNRDEVLAKVYIFKIGLNTNVSEVYQMLKLRAAQAPNIKVNETNQYGVASFYMNDQLRLDTAFLTVRISGLIYAFSYPKMYHSQVKNLLQLIQWELG